MPRIIHSSVAGVALSSRPSCKLSTVDDALLCVLEHSVMPEGTASFITVPSALTRPRWQKPVFACHWFFFTITSASFLSSFDLLCLLSVSAAVVIVAAARYHSVWVPIHSADFVTHLFSLMAVVVTGNCE